MSFDLQNRRAKPNDLVFVEFAYEQLEHRSIPAYWVCISEENAERLGLVPARNRIPPACEKGESTSLNLRGPFRDSGTADDWARRINEGAKGWKRAKGAKLERLLHSLRLCASARNELGIEVSA